MKRNFSMLLFSLIILGIVSNFMACKKDDDDDPTVTDTTTVDTTGVDTMTNNVNTDPGVSAKIDGVAWYVPPANITASYGTPSTLSINALADDGSSITMIMQGQEGQPGSFALSTDTADGKELLYSESSGTPNFIGFNEAIIITEWDAVNKTVSGTFSCSAQIFSNGQTRVITEGVFNDISY